MWRGGGSHTRPPPAVPHPPTDPKAAFQQHPSPEKPKRELEKHPDGNEWSPVECQLRGPRRNVPVLRGPAEGRSGRERGPLRYELPLSRRGVGGEHRAPGDGPAERERTRLTGHDLVPSRDLGGR